MSDTLVYVVEFVCEQDGKFLHKVKLPGVDNLVDAYTEHNSLGVGTKCGLRNIDGMPMLFCNCLTCGRGSRGWSSFDGKPKCLECEGNPLVEDDGREDWRDWCSAKMVAVFGGRSPGDGKLFEKYADELSSRGW